MRSRWRPLNEYHVTKAGDGHDARRCDSSLAQIALRIAGRSWPSHGYDIYIPHRDSWYLEQAGPRAEGQTVHDALQR
jgi:hypothetical protein